MELNLLWTECIWKWGRQAGRQAESVPNSVSGSHQCVPRHHSPVRHPRPYHRSGSSASSFLPRLCRRPGRRPQPSAPRSIHRSTPTGHRAAESIRPPSTRRHESCSTDERAPARCSTRDGARRPANLAASNQTMDGHPTRRHHQRSSSRSYCARKRTSPGPGTSREGHRQLMYTSKHPHEMTNLIALFQASTNALKIVVPAALEVREMAVSAPIKITLPSSSDNVSCPQLSSH
jgi:hypothetical protein